jgi:hypothetical protein
MNRLVRGALGYLHQLGTRVQAAGVGPILEDLDKAAQEVSTRAKRARKRAQELEARVKRAVEVEVEDDTEED